MADAKTTPLTITKASPEEAAPGDSPDIPDIEMVDSTREWPVENDAWQYLHEDVQDSAAAKEQAAHEVLMPPLTPCHKMDDEQQKSMEDLNTAIASMQVTFDALAVGAPAAEKLAPEGAGALGPGTPEGGEVVSSRAPGSANLTPWISRRLLGSARWRFLPSLASPGLHHRRVLRHPHLW